MLFGLTKELRKIGLDCYQIFSYSDLDKCIELAKREQRFVLTRNSRFLLFRRKVPENQCLQIPSDTTENQTIHLLQLLNIQIDEKDVHSRCVKCNCKDFLLATRSQIHTMRDGYMDNLKGINEPTKIKHEFLKRSWNLCKQSMFMTLYFVFYQDIGILLASLIFPLLPYHICTHSRKMPSSFSFAI